MLPPLSFGVLLAVLQLSQAINIYLHPPTHLYDSTLSPEDASAALSRHLGLEFFEPLRVPPQVTYQEEPFIAQGLNDALLVVIEENEMQAILPAYMPPPFTLSEPYSNSVDGLSTVVRTYLHRARHTYESLFSHEGPWLPEDIQTLVSFFKSSEGSAFAAVDLNFLVELRTTLGPLADEYITAVSTIQDFLYHAISENKVNLAVVTYSSKTPQGTQLKRQLDARQSQSPLPSPNRPPPQEPIGSVSTCFTTADACNNGTNTCSGRGQCVEATKAGRTCFVCTCGVTKTGQGSQVKTEYWVGQSCERKDISGPFVLLTGTVVVIILLLFGSVSLLYSVGDQALPSTLLATAVTAKKE